MRISNFLSRGVSWFFLTLFSFITFFPNYSYAGGPTQPEVQGFTPASVSDMVDPFTGDFTYNIPLMEIEGYPLNLAYNSGITMDQEASWVGLGWSLNSGAISRGLRGLPDDFDGDLVEKTLSTKPITNIGIEGGLGGEFFGLGGTAKGVEISYNTHTGFGAGVNVSPSFSMASKGGLGLTGGFTLSGSSENGASFSPNLSMSSRLLKKRKGNHRLGLTVGSSMNSRAGLQAVSYSTSFSKTERRTVRSVNKARDKFKKEITGSYGANGSFDLGLANYSPTPGPKMTGVSIMGRLAITNTAWGADAQVNVGINYSRNWIPDHYITRTSKAYGYMNSKKGESDIDGLLDFNRDNDAAFSKYSKDLPSAFQTYDIFSIQAQGVGGSFRAYRNDVGYVFDPLSVNENFSGNFGVELGLGALLDLGGDIQVGFTESKSGAWIQSNNVKNSLNRITNGSGVITPEFTMLEANEKSVDSDQMVNQNFGGSKPVQYKMTPDNPIYSNLTPALQYSESSSVASTTNNNKRSSRVITNTQMYFLSNAEVQAGFGVDAFKLTGNLHKPHHIGEITQLGMDGRRYVFGLPVYNHFQNDVTFAVGETLYGNQSYTPINDNDFSGLLQLGSEYGELDSPNNKSGIDQYFSDSKTPAYAHSFMLTSVLSDDYVDADATQGPSSGDLGSYVKFDYEKVENHEWRTPMDVNTVFFNEGLKSDAKDDKASFVHGKKDLYYVVKIESKNQILVFTLDDIADAVDKRKDGASVNGRSGGTSPQDQTKNQRKLNKIALYNLADFQANGTNATVLQQVNFKYDYSRCVGYPGNASGGGKLTLTEIYFTYQGSHKMNQRRYKFDYSNFNPTYSLKSVDRWGCYKPLLASNSDTPLNPFMTNSDFPYTEQNNSNADLWASAWHMTGIDLPSGGHIEVSYEADDYGYVQHKPAQRMFEIVAVTDQDVTNPATIHTTPGFENISSVVGLTSNTSNRAIWFEMDNPTDDISQYVKENQQLYFRCLTDMSGMPSGYSSFGTEKSCENISGYANVKSLAEYVISGEKYGKIILEPETMKDIGADMYSPITKAAILFGRTQLSRTINLSSFLPDQEPGGGVGVLKDFAGSIIGSIGSFKELVTGPNLAIYIKNKGTRIVTNKSIIRLREPDATKTGGGSRVSMIKMSDKWDQMTNLSASESDYGQVYSYKLENGESSGVASYEPQIGGDENPWHTAYLQENVKRFAPDDNLFIEDPIMESQFPSPSIGYSRVTISSLKYDNVKRTATGKVVKEFYTAKDFPTVVKKSNIQVQPKNRKLPLLKKYQLLNASQGFVIELNDMHGKPKSENVFAEGQTEPLSSVDYIYQRTALGLDGAQNYKLNNQVKTISRSGNVSNPEIGVRYDVVADFRESETNSINAKLPLNTNSMIVGIPIVIPTVWPKVDITQNRFRSATLNKTINRFGILKETRAMQDGSVVTTQNLAYDAETGDVLVSKTKTNFNDDIYSMNYPAYWNYHSLGRASKNIAYTYSASTIYPNGFTVIPFSANHFLVGDEVVCTGGGTDVKAWVTKKTTNGIVLVDKAGQPINGSNITIEVVRSGNKNKQGTSMGEMTSYSNPISTIKTNSFKDVLNATAVEFSQEWKTYCGCFEDVSTLTTNPFVLGTKGNWRPWRSYTYLADRTQSNYNGNTNIRKDGIYTGYNPFYKLDPYGRWEKDGDNWTYVSEVTEFSPNGMTLETKDALGRYSTNAYGFNSTLTIGTAVNTRSTQFALANFEDEGVSSCTAQGFFAEPYDAGSSVIFDEGHTGRTSIKVPPSTSVVYEKYATVCEGYVTCNVSAEFSGNNIITLTGGDAPYQMNFTGSQGAYAYMVSPNQFQYYFPNNAAPSVSITINVIDDAGCERTYILHPNSSSGPGTGLPASSGLQNGTSTISSDSQLELIQIAN